jgi:hypothetical protein
MLLNPLLGSVDGENLLTPKHPPPPSLSFTSPTVEIPPFLCHGCTLKLHYSERSETFYAHLLYVTVNYYTSQYFDTLFW